MADSPPSEWDGHPARHSGEDAAGLEGLASGLVLVTGAGGFLGGAIARRLVKGGRQVRSFSRGGYPELEPLGVEQIRGDLADPKAVGGAVRGCELVFHVAAKAGIWGDFEDFYQANVKGTHNVLEACRNEGVTRLVHTSSPSVVFDGSDMEGVDESVPYPDHYKAHYPATKAEAEAEVLAANGPELATVALRPHLIWGPRDTHIVPGILARARSGRLRKISGPQKRVDFTYVDNAAEAHLLAAARLEPGSPVAGRAFFVSDDAPVPLWEFIDRVLAAAGLPPVEKTISPRVAYAAGWLLEKVYGTLRLSGEPRLTRFVAEELATSHWFDIGAARRLLGYRPVVEPEEGLRRLAEWLR